MTGIEGEDALILKDMEYKLSNGVKFDEADMRHLVSLLIADRNAFMKKANQLDVSRQIAQTRADDIEELRAKDSTSHAEMVDAALKNAEDLQAQLKVTRDELQAFAALPDQVKKLEAELAAAEKMAQMEHQQAAHHFRVSQQNADQAIQAQQEANEHRTQSAQAKDLFFEVSLRLRKIKKTWAKFRMILGVFEDGPASPTPDRKGVVVKDAPGTREAFDAFTREVMGE